VGKRSVQSSPRREAVAIANPAGVPPLGGSGNEPRQTKPPKGGSPVDAPRSVVEFLIPPILNCTRFNPHTCSQGR
jgi:hypothetical protein